MDNYIIVTLKLRPINNLGEYSKLGHGMHSTTKTLNFDFLVPFVPLWYMSSEIHTITKLPIPISPHVFSCGLSSKPTD